jgi:hypothetical protein
MYLQGKQLWLYLVNNHRRGTEKKREMENYLNQKEGLLAVNTSPTPEMNGIEARNSEENY